MPVSVDSGFRRGTDIVKALAMGAEALCIQRRLAAGVAGYSRLVA
jgi:4-hydroxymandelate oxidase